MIRPRNIDIESHTADFKCDTHGGEVTGLNVNTNMTYDEETDCNVILGSELTESCACKTDFPLTSSNELAVDLASAKTA